MLIAALASATLLGVLMAAPEGSAQQLQQSGAAKKRVQLKCPLKFTAKCNKYQRVVCVQNDKRGCCTKSICQ
jgi:hypothetical protein